MVLSLHLYFASGRKGLGKGSQMGSVDLIYTDSNGFGHIQRGSSKHMHSFTCLNRINSTLSLFPLLSLFRLSVHMKIICSIPCVGAGGARAVG